MWKCLIQRFSHGTVEALLYTEGPWVKAPHALLGGGIASEVTHGGVLPYMGEGPLRRSLMSVPFLRNSALMLLVFDHWNEKEMVSGLPSLKFPRCELPGKKWSAGQTGLSGAVAAVPWKPSGLLHTVDQSRGIITDS